MAGIQFIVKHKIIERQELTAANNVQEGILFFQGSADALRVWQTELMAKLNEIEKQAILKKAA